MRWFYLAYTGRISQIAQTVSGQLQDVSVQWQPPVSLSWSHYVFLIGLKEEERNFYEIEAAQQGWTLRELRRQFDAGLYERLALRRDKQAIHDLARKGQHITKPQDLLKDPYVLEFLGIEEKARYSESYLESAIVTHVEKFLLELGMGFLFESRQKRIRQRWSNGENAVASTYSDVTTADYTRRARSASSERRGDRHRSYTKAVASDSANRRVACTQNQFAPDGAGIGGCRTLIHRTFEPCRPRT